MISAREAERQSSLLVRGHPPDLGSSWQVLQPDLDEIVLAYLSGLTMANWLGPPRHTRAEGDPS